MQPNKPTTSDLENGRIITGHEEFQRTAVAIVATAKREIRLLSNNLDTRLYNREDISNALKDFILLSSHSRLRILLQDDNLAARGHRVIELARTLSSFVEIRTLAESQRSVQADWLVVDEQQVLERQAPDTLEARYYPSNAPLARARCKQFDSWWQVGEPASRLRSLHFG